MTASTSDPRSTPPDVATGMTNNTKKQCEKFDWVYAEELQSSVGRAWWSYTVLTWPGECWTMINWLFSLILWSMDCLFFNNKHSEMTSNSVAENFWFKIHVLRYLKSPYAFLFLQSVFGVNSWKSTGILYLNNCSKPHHFPKKEYWAHKASVSGGVMEVYSLKYIN